MQTTLPTAASEAWRLISTLDADVFSAVRVSLVVSLAATLLAAVFGLPLGYLLGTRNFPGRNAAAAVLQTMTAVPTVVIGLICYGLLSASGPFGGIHLLYTPVGMAFGEFCLIVPLVTMLTMSATQGIDIGIRETALTLGAKPLQAAVAVMREGRFAYVTAIATGFGRAIGEVGVAMMVGGNIRGFTRTMTTTLALETEKGNFSLGVAIGIILLATALCVNAFLNYMKSRAGRI